MNIAVFLSQYDVAEKYQNVAKTFARLIAEGGHGLVWGGADEGLMSIVANTAKSGGSRIVGVIREQIKGKAHAGADEMHVVKNAYEMNLGIIERADAIVALVGGIGTLNELTEVLRMNKSGLHTKPVIFINTDNFYDGFKAQLVRMSAESFLKKEVMDSAYFAATPEDAMRYITKHGD